MGKKEKLKDRFLSRPSDLTWDELVSFLKNYGYIEKAKGKSAGSRRTFIREIENDKQIICLHEPHSPNIVKRCYIDQVRQKLEEDGVL